MYFHDDIEEALQLLREYIITHSKSRRNGKILELVIYEGCSLEEAAKAAGCSAAVVSYVVHEAQRYAREMRGH